MSELSPGLPDGTNPTLDAVAARAGVSPITVSRVVRTPDKVRAAIRARVEGGYCRRRPGQS
jgi:LacI family gluconate utilization system Gnt-I transcriptional repressor